MERHEVGRARTQGGGRTSLPPGQHAAGRKPSSGRTEASPDGHTELDPNIRHEMIAEAAYYLAEKRGFAPGKELEDWREAESWINEYMAAGKAR